MLDPSRIDPSLARVVQGFPLSRGRRNARAEAPVTRAFLYATLIDSPLLIFVFAFYFFFLATQGKYSVFVTGGNVNVGYRSRMTCYSGQRRGNAKN